MTRITKQEWIDAGRGIAGINADRVNEQLGVKVPNFVTFDDFAQWVYKAITGQRLESPYIGRGRSSRWWGKKVAEVWEDEPAPLKEEVQFAKCGKKVYPY